MMEMRPVFNEQKVLYLLDRTEKEENRGTNVPYSSVNHEIQRETGQIKEKMFSIFDQNRDLSKIRNKRSSILRTKN